VLDGKISRRIDQNCHETAGRLRTLASLITKTTRPAAIRTRILVEGCWVEGPSAAATEKPRRPKVIMLFSRRRGLAVLLSLVASPSPRRLLCTACVAVQMEDARCSKRRCSPRAQAAPWLRRRFPSLTDTDDLVQESYARLLRARQAGCIANPKKLSFHHRH